jgi:NitT/TauT family transport system permease protein
MSGHVIGRLARRRHAGQTSRRLLDTVVMLAALVLVWQLLYELIGDIALSPPVTTAINAYALLASADFWPNVASTFRALGIALVIQIISGVVFGVMCGLNKLLGDVVEPVLVSFYSIPKIVFYPIVLMFCGIGVWSAVVFAVMHGILPVLLYTMISVRTIKPVLRKTSRVMHLSFVQTMLCVALPTAAPDVFTGIRIGFGATMLSVLLSEMFGSKSGLGFLMMSAMALNNVDRIMALTLLLAGFAAIVNLILLAIDTKLHRRV